MTTLYLAGPMTSYPEWNFPAFDRATAELRAKGYAVVSPAELDRAAGFDPKAPVENYTEADRHKAMRNDLLVVLNYADGVATLPFWQESQGAQLEVRVADAIGLPVRAYIAWPDLTKGTDQ